MQKSAELFIKNLPEFIKFLEKTPSITLKKNKITNKVIDSVFLNHELYQQKIAVTGFTIKTDLEVQKIFTKYQIQNSSSVSSKCWGVIVKDINPASGKRKKADKLGLVVISRDEFVKLYK